MKDRGKMFVHMVSGAPTIVMEFGIESKIQLNFTFNL